MSLLIIPVEHAYMHDAYITMEIHDGHVLTRAKELAFQQAWAELISEA